MNTLTRTLLFCSLLSSPFFLHSQSVIYVNASIAGGNEDGSSWQNAFPELRSAILAAQSGDRIWVAKGTYLPTAGTDRNIPFLLKNGVEMYGGFAGGETDESQRDWLNNETILSGDIGVPGDTSDNSYTVVYTQNAGPETLLDGFVITKGMADDTNNTIPSSSRLKCGGGLYMYATSGAVNPRILNCTFRHNFSSTAGGAVYIGGLNNTFSYPDITHCTFLENSTAGIGGALSKHNGSDNPLVFHGIHNCHFEKNYSDKTGSAIYYIDNTGNTNAFKLKDCTIVRNRSKTTGAIFYHDYNPFNLSVEIEDCYFIENQSANGACFAIQTLLETIQGIRITGTTFISNQVSSNGGVIFLDGGYTAPDCMVVENCIFEQNTASTGGVFFISPSLNSGSVTLRNSTFSNNNSKGAGGVAYSLIPMNIRSCKFTFNFSQNSSGGVFAARLKSIENCLFDGNYAKEGGAIRAYNTANDTVTIINSVFYQNYATEVGGAVHIPRLAATNSIFWQNTAPEGSNFHPANHAVLNHCLLKETSCGAIDNIFISGNTTQTGSFTCNASIFNQNPLFTDAPGGDFRLQPCSPARNTGNSAIALTKGLTTDLAGNPRILESSVDMGAYESPAFSVKVASVQASCSGGQTGAVIFETTNACQPLSYGWSSGSGSGTGASGLNAGLYQFTVTDALGNKDSLAVTIPSSTGMTAIASGLPVVCSAGTGGSAGVLANGGTAPYSFLWSNQATSPAIQNLPGGLYTVTVTDAVGCTTTASAQVAVQGKLALSINVTPIACPPGTGAGTTGAATVTPLDGLPPYNWLWQDGQTSQTASGLTGGSYSVTVSDAAGCSDVLNFSMQSPAALVATATAMHVPCGGGKGSASVTATGGTSPYTWLWSNFQTLPVNTNLNPGTYFVTVTDKNNCKATDTVTVEDSPALEVIIEGNGPACAGGQDGWLATLPGGGSPPFSYIWGNGLTDSLYAQIPAGTYFVTVTDSHDCSKTAHFTLNEPDTMSLSGVNILHASAQTAGDGAVFIGQISGGTAPYSLLWSNGSTGLSLENVAPGNYTLSVTDSAGCGQEFHFTVSFGVAAEEAWRAGFRASISPNPVVAGGTAVLRIHSAAGQVVQVQLFDGQGRSFPAERFWLAAGENPIPLPAAVQEGIFFIKIQGESGTQLVLKWVVI